MPIRAPPRDAGGGPRRGAAAALAIVPKGVPTTTPQIVLDYATVFERYLMGSDAGERETVRTVARGSPPDRDQARRGSGTFPGSSVDRCKQHWSGLPECLSRLPKPPDELRQQRAAAGSAEGIPSARRRHGRAGRARQTPLHGLCRLGLGVEDHQPARRQPAVELHAAFAPCDRPRRLRHRRPDRRHRQGAHPRRHVEQLHPGARRGDGAPRSTT